MDRESNDIPPESETTTINYAEDVQKDLIDTRKDSGKVAIAIALMAIFLLVVFYFGFRQNFTELRHKVEALNGLQTRVVSLEQDVEALKALPEKTRYMVMGTMAQEMANKAEYLNTQAASEEQRAKILQAKKLLENIQQEFAAAAR
ncbi:MAG: hypothetical protein WCR47_02455 [Desulfoplanes sp.]